MVPDDFKQNNSLEIGDSLTDDTEKNLNLSYAFHLMKKSEVSLFLTFLINFSASIQYYILVTLIPLYFSSLHNYSDIQSGLVFGGFGIIIGICSLLLSSKMHQISFDRGLNYSFLLGISGFILLLFNHELLSLISILLFQSISCSIAWPFAEYGIKEYSSKEILHLTNSCFFISNYSAGILAGLIIDTMWTHIDNKETIFFITSIIGIIFLLVALISLRFCRKLDIVSKPVIESKALWKIKNFWRFTLLIFLLILLRSMSFGHLDATLPKYITRVQGDQAHFGIMLTVHSFTMILALFFLTSLTYLYSSLTLITLGAFLGCIGCIFIMLSDNLLACVLFVMVISVGESIWVPRLLDYTDDVALEGQEGVYLAMSNCPFYFGMMLTGGASGILLQNYCPDDQDVEDCSNVWVFVFLSSLIISACLVLLRGVILESKESDEEKSVAIDMVNVIN